MNIIQKIVDGGLLALAVLLVAGVILGATPRPTVAERYTYTPGALVLACDVGHGPKWDELKGLTANLR
jgi:hypothetical protein